MTLVDRSISLLSCFFYQMDGAVKKATVKVISPDFSQIFPKDYDVSPTHV